MAVSMWPRRFLLSSLLVVVALGAMMVPAASGRSLSAFSFSLVGSSLTQCWFYLVGFNATEGEKFVIVWNETNFPPISMNFYIVPQGWLGVPWNCFDGPAALYFNDGAIGSATWTASTGGSYAIILVNYSTSNVSGVVSIAAVNATVFASPIGYGAVLPFRCRSPDPIFCYEPSGP